METKNTSCKPKLGHSPRLNLANGNNGNPFLVVARLLARSPCLVVHVPRPTEKQSKASIINHSPFTTRTANTCTFSGASANAGPHYQKLYARVTHIWGNRKGQPDPSAMKGPRLERTASLITVPPASGKYEKPERGPSEGKTPYLYILVVVLGFDASSWLRF